MIVNFDDIEIMHPDYGGGNVYYYQGKPYSGIINEFHNNGNLAGEITVVNSHTQGRVAIYHVNGKIAEEFFEKYNRMYSTYKKWDENGNLLLEHDYGKEPE